MGWKSKAQGIAASLKAEYEAGKRGDDTPPAPIWATPQQQLDALLALFRSSPTNVAGEGESADVDADVDVDVVGDAGAADPETDATAVATAMQGVDWAGVRAATLERTNDAAKAMKAMAEQVDWDRVQPVAAQVSSALIAAIATGQLGVGGRLGSTVARAITNQGGLGQQVADRLKQSAVGVPDDFGGTIQAASREA